MANSMYDLDSLIESPPFKTTAELVDPSHYKLPIEPWDYIIANNMNFLEGNVIKYVSRYKKKGGREDLLKARTYLDKLIETLV